MFWVAFHSFSLVFELKLFCVLESKIGKIKRYTWSTSSIELFFEGLMQVIVNLLSRSSPYYIFPLSMPVLAFRYTLGLTVA